jgi:hypothetical protein
VVGNSPLLLPTATTRLLWQCTASLHSAEAQHASVASS